MNEPLELAAVQRDDTLLDRIGSRLEPVGGSDAVAALLLQWRADICDDEQAPPDEGRAPAIVTVPRRSARPLLGAIVMAGVLLSASGVAAAATRAAPGSVLWPVTQVVAARHAQSVLARERVLQSLAVAQRQATRGNKVAAQASLDDAMDGVGQVQAADGKSKLQAQVAAMQAALNSAAVAAAAAPQPSASPAPSPSAGQPTAAASASATPAPSPSPAASADPSPTPDPSPAPAAPSPADGATGP